MGCYNESCMLTGLPICCGERVYAVMLMENAVLGQSHCSTSEFIPVALFEGEYNDYGSVESVVGSMHERVMSVLRKHAGKDLACAECDYEVNGLDDNITDIIYTMNRDSIGLVLPSAEHHRRTFCRLRTVFLKADLVDHVLEDLIHQRGVYPNDGAFWGKWMFPVFKPDKDTTFHALFSYLSMRSGGNYHTKDFVQEILGEEGLDNGAAAMYHKLIQLNFLLTRLCKSWCMPSGRSQENYDPVYGIFLSACKTELDRIVSEETAG